MKKKSSITVIAITAFLTFGTLFAVKGSMYRHHWKHHTENCSTAEQENNNCHFQFDKSKHQKFKSTK